MYRAEVSSWNLRDRHMAATLEALVSHLDHQLGRARVVVWEHNSHVGDARATADGRGRRAERRPTRRARAGRTDSPSRRLHHRPRPGHRGLRLGWSRPSASTSDRRCRAATSSSSIRASSTGSSSPSAETPVRALRDARLERAIGVIYRPQTERASHWFHARLPDQFDAVIHFDRTTAVEPLERTSLWDEGEPPETFPTGL